MGKSLRRSTRVSYLSSAVAAMVLMATAALGLHNYNPSAGAYNVKVGQSATGSSQAAFHPAYIQIPSGSTVTFDFAAGSHNAGQDSTATPNYDSTFQSPAFDPADGGSQEPLGTSYAHTFNAVGTYNYFCGVHSNQAAANVAAYGAPPAETSGKMVGRVEVVAGATPTPTATGAGTPTPTATGGATPTPTATGGATPTPTATGAGTPTPTSTATAPPSPSATPQDDDDDDGCKPKKTKKSK